MARETGPGQRFVGVHELIAEVSLRHPDEVAVESDLAALKYAELERRVAALAATLRERGVGPGEVVGVWTERCPEEVVATLAILRCGAAFLLLDPELPELRLRRMLDEVAASTLVSVAGLADRAPLAPETVVRADLAWGDRGRLGAGEVPVAPSDLAYVMYTSGSTGHPKGVMVEHRGLANLAAAQPAMMDMAPGSRVLRFASPAFDTSIWDIFGTLAAGATLVTAPPSELRAMPRLDALLDQRGITTITMPPSILAQLDAAGHPSLQTVVTAGEACSPALADRWSRGRTLVNSYGPAEGTVCATVGRLEPGAPRVTIGSAMAGVEVAVLDEALRPVPAGEVGELFIGGAGLARGYLAQPELTAERFVMVGDTRMYRTGDLVRGGDGGELEFVGRRDRQVKIRAQRVELQEVESVLESHEAVARAAVVAKLDDPETARLVAFVASRPGSDGTDAQDLRRWLATRLPAYMVPASVMVLDALPLTTSGKVDYEELRAREEAVPAGGSNGQPAEARAAAGPVEAAVAAIWQRVLGLEAVDPDADFFMLGGQSLQAAEMVALVGDELGVKLPFYVLFEHPTVATLAAAIEEQRAGGTQERGARRLMRGARRSLRASARRA